MKQMSFHSINSSKKKYLKMENILSLYPNYSEDICFVQVIEGFFKNHTFYSEDLDVIPGGRILILNKNNFANI